MKSLRSTWLVGVGVYEIQLRIECRYKPSCQTQDYIDISLRYLEYLPWAGSFPLHIFCKHSWADCLTARAVFSALRVHALSQRNWYLTLFTFVWGMIAFPLDYYVSRGLPPCLLCVVSRRTRERSIVGSISKTRT